MSFKANFSLLRETKDKKKEIIGKEVENNIYICQYLNIGHDNHETSIKTLGLYKCIEKAFDKIYEEILKEIDINEKHSHYNPSERFLFNGFCFSEHILKPSNTDRWGIYSGTGEYTINEWSLDDTGSKFKKTWYLNLDIMIKEHIINNKLSTDKKVKEYIHNLLFERDIGRKCLDIEKKSFKGAGICTSCTGIVHNMQVVSDEYVNKWNKIYKT
jgi:hypothetical protein